MNFEKIFSYALGPILGGILSFITLPMVTWYFSPQDVGRMALFQIFISFSVMILSLGMHQAFVREYNTIDNKSTLLIAAIFPSNIIFLILISTYYFIPISISNILFDIDSSKISTGAFIVVFSAVTVNFLSHLLRMQERGYSYSLSIVIPKLALLVVIIISTKIFVALDFQILMLAYVIAYAISFITLSSLTKNVIFNINEFDVKLLKRMLIFGIPLVAGGIAYWALTAIDRVLLKEFSTFKELAIYGVASSIAGVAVLLGGIFSSIWHPLVYRWVDEGIEVCKVERTIECLALIVALVWALISALSWVVEFFLPNEYKGISYIVIACVASPFLFLLSETTVIGIGISRKSIYSMYASIVAFLINLLLNYLFIPSMGAKGAALSSAAAFLVFFALRTEFSCFLWESISRIKIYSFVFIYLIATFFTVLTELNPIECVLIWVLVLLIVIIIYRKRLMLEFKLISEKRNRSNLESDTSC